MDVLAPDLMWIDGRCYRIPTLDSAFSNCDVSELKDRDLECEADNMGGYEMEEEVPSDMPNIESVSGRWTMMFPVARSFLPFIIGSKGATVKRISKDTSCVIFTPRFNEEQIITIRGPNRKNVILAWKNITFVINSTRKKMVPTHFISLPLISDEIKENFKKFKEDILFSCTARGVCEDLFLEPDKLHITVAVCVLTDDNERKQAEEKFNEICNGIVSPMLKNIKPCTLEMQGLDIMNDDPSETRVLYGNVNIKGHDGLLQELCNKIFDAFKVMCFVKQEHTQVKIHATLMNVSHLIKDEMEGIHEGNVPLRKFDKRFRETFDATNILEVPLRVFTSNGFPIRFGNITAAGIIICAPSHTHTVYRYNSFEKIC